MRTAHCMNRLYQGGLHDCRGSPRNTRERAVGTAENGSTRDSSEAVPTADKEDSCLSLGISQYPQESPFTG